MDIRQMPKGTLFRLFRETFITTSEYYYCPHDHIHKVKAHNITTGTDDEIGEIAMFEAHPIKPQEKPMNPQLTYNDMKNLKVGDLLRFQRSHGASDTNPIDTVAVVTVPFGQVLDKQGNVACAVKVHCEPVGSFKLEGVTSHNFHLFRKLS